MMADYKILTCEKVDDILAFQEKVTQHLRDGWLLAGGVSVRSYSKQIGGIVYHDIQMIQAVYKT